MQYKQANVPLKLQEVEERWWMYGVPCFCYLQYIYWFIQANVSTHHILFCRRKTWLDFDARIQRKLIFFWHILLNRCTIGIFHVIKSCFPIHYIISIALLVSNYLRPLCHSISNASFSFSDNHCRGQDSCQSREPLWWCETNIRQKGNFLPGCS